MVEPDVREDLALEGPLHRQVVDGVHQRQRGKTAKAGIEAGEHGEAGEVDLELAAVVPQRPEVVVAVLGTDDERAVDVDAEV